LVEGFLLRRFFFFENEVIIFSDGTLNPNGIRFGSAEIYSIVDQFNSEICDSLCVAQRNPTTDNERVILFLKVSEQKRKKEKQKNDGELFFYSNTLCLIRKRCVFE